MSTSPAPRYTIDRLEDFAEVPDDRLDDCLAEFAMAVRSHREFRAAIRARSESLGLPDPGELITIRTWTWTDDGRRVTRVEFAETAEEDATP